MFKNLKKFIIGKSEGMEMVEAAILIAIVVVIGMIFKDQLTNFINGVFEKLIGTEF